MWWLGRCRAASPAVFTALMLGATATAVPQARPLHTFCEVEDNDTWDRAQVLDANVAAAVSGVQQPVDCFFVTGKLQMDYIWDIEPKCALRAYAKPQPARTSTGQAIPGQTYEPILASSNVGVIDSLTPNDDNTVRLAVASLMDAFDGTVNGLSQNGPHNERGEVTVELFINRSASQLDGVTPDQSYVFRFKSGTDALRLAFIAPGAQYVTVRCRQNTGTVGVCYDTDFYRIVGLVPGNPYCITVVGGVTDRCTKTDTVLGWYDKQGYRIGGDDGFNDDHAGTVYPEICVYADVDGSIWFAISGKGDEDFDGLLDATEDQYFDFLALVAVRHGFVAAYRQGASVTDASAADVIRYPRAFVDRFGETVTFWEDPRYAALFAPGAPPEAHVAHGVCGSYCIKVQPAEHTSGGQPPVGQTGAARADINNDGVINASDLALLLSYWGVRSN